MMCTKTSSHLIESVNMGLKVLIELCFCCRLPIDTTKHVLCCKRNLTIKWKRNLFSRNSDMEEVSSSISLQLVLPLRDRYMFCKGSRKLSSKKIAKVASLEGRETRIPKLKKTNLHFHPSVLFGQLLVHQFPGDV